MLLICRKNHCVLLARNQKVNMLATFELWVRLRVIEAAVVESSE